MTELYIIFTSDIIYKRVRLNLGGGNYMGWSIRNLLYPIITRCLIYGVSPFDLEAVLRDMEKKPMLNSKMLENAWMSGWQEKADHFISLAKEESKNNNSISVSDYYNLASKCYYACYLLNSDTIENKKNIYEKLVDTYWKYLVNSERRVEKVKVPFEKDIFLTAYLHLPNENKFKAPYPCVIIPTGYGSCKEEVEIETEPLVERGVAVLAVDMPGTGESLFAYHTILSGENVEKAFEHIISFCNGHELIDEERLGTYGLCMGGGFAFHAAAKYPQIKCCVNLFPLFISLVDMGNIPGWMKLGKWASFQIGEGGTEEFVKGMAVMAEGTLKCNYLLVHSSYDNWMELEKTEFIFGKAEGKRQEIVIDNEPVYATKESVMHAMPVGEQMHWVKRKAADYCVRAFQS